MRVLVIASVLAIFVLPAIADGLDKQCLSYGFRPGTDAFATCKMQLDQQMQADRQARLRAFAAGMAAFGRSLQNTPVYAPPPTVTCNTQRMGTFSRTHCY